jgi:hypothetical protein
MSWIPGVDHTVINVGWFADNTMPLLGVAAQLGVFPFPLGTGRNAPVSNEDIGRVAAAVLLDPAPHVGRTLRPTGPELLSPEDIARIYGEALGRPVKHQDISMKMFSKALRAMDLVEPLLATQLAMYVTEYRNGNFASGGPTDVVERLTGRPPENFATITRRYAEADPMTRRTFGNKLRAFVTMAKIIFTAPYDDERLQRESGLPMLPSPTFCDADAAWRRSHTAPNAYGVSQSQAA